MNLRNIISILFCLTIPNLIAYFSISSESLVLNNNIPLIYYCIALSFTVHWIVFIPSYLNKTEKFFDFTGMVTYLSVIIFALYSKYNILGKIDFESIILAVLISIWSLRLGLFLFYRIVKAGEDDRFSELKKSFSKFLVVWTLSGLWVSLTSIAALTILTSKITNKEYYFVYLGIAVWLFGFLFEIIADYQKTKFKSNINNKDNFIDKGLWSLSRHPNYFGEIVLWIGIFFISIPSISGWQYILLISPIFVYFLLTNISGINLLEAKAEKKWGNLDSYKEYKEKTPQLIPKFWN